jgi:hypothetical protein
MASSFKARLLMQTYRCLEGGANSSFACCRRDTPEGLARAKALRVASYREAVSFNA